MFDPVWWEALITGTECAYCRRAAPSDPELRVPVGTLPSGEVFLQRDGNFPGYCILYLRRHAAELFELTPSERASLIEDVAALAHAIWTVCRPSKLNYAILGNELPHLHVHVIPRYPDDGWWGKPIWLRPHQERVELPEPRAREIAEALRRELSSYEGQSHER
ncbi:MAG: HIT family protein [Chthonomonadales bacterium]